MYKSVFIVLLFIIGCVDFLDTNIVEVENSAIENNTLKEKMVYEEHINNDYDMFIPSLVYVVSSDSQTPAEKMACRK